MPSREDLKAHLCIGGTAAEFPLDPFADWLTISLHRQLLQQLNGIQEELDADEREWCAAAEYGSVVEARDQARRWARYCAQLRAHYQQRLEAAEKRLDKRGV